MVIAPEASCRLPPSLPPKAVSSHGSYQNGATHGVGIHGCRRYFAKSESAVFGKAIRTKTSRRLGAPHRAVKGLAETQYTQCVGCDADHIPLITFLLPRGNRSYFTSLREPASERPPK
jgi:hypothetical protein